MWSFASGLTKHAACHHPLLLKRLWNILRQNMLVGINACWHTQWNSTLWSNTLRFPEETSLPLQTQPLSDDLVYGFVMSLSFHFTGPPVNVTCNIFINSFGSITETTMVSSLWCFGWFLQCVNVLSIPQLAGPPVNVTCNIFINSFGSIAETTMVSWALTSAQELRLNHVVFILPT